MQTQIADQPTDEPSACPRFRVQLLDQSAAPAQSARNYTEALAGIARAHRCPLAGLFTVYDTAARSFLVWLPSALDASIG